MSNEDEIRQRLRGVQLLLEYQATMRAQDARIADLEAQIAQRDARIEGQAASSERLVSAYGEQRLRIDSLEAEIARRSDAMRVQQDRIIGLEARIKLLEEHADDLKTESAAALGIGEP